MQKRTITFTYTADDNIKVGDLIGLLCENYEADEVLSNNSTINLGELTPKSVEIKENCKETDNSSIKDDLFDSDLNEVKKIKADIKDYIHKSVSLSKSFYYTNDYDTETNELKVNVFEKTDSYALYKFKYYTLLAVYIDAKEEYDKFLANCHEEDNKEDNNILISYHLDIDYADNDKISFDTISFTDLDEFKEFIRTARSFKPEEEGNVDLSFAFYNKQKLNNLD